MTTAPRLWITGAGGFVGRRLCEHALAAGWQVLASSRHPEDLPVRPGLTAVTHAAATDSRDFGSVDVVIHAAARAHQLRDDAADPLEAFRAVNVHGSLEVARAAARRGARRLVFISSIGVHGNATTGRPFTEADAPDPQEPYAVSKLEAEQALAAACRESSLEWVTVRPPLIYGPGAPGNFDRLLKLGRLGWPLPLGAIDNRRSFIGLDNLCDFLLLAARHPQAQGQPFVIADGEDLSTTALLREIARASGRPDRLWSLPLPLLRGAARLAGQGGAFEKLSSSLQVDASKARQRLGWTPRHSVRAGIEQWVRG